MSDILALRSKLNQSIGQSNVLKAQLRTAKVQHTYWKIRLNGLELAQVFFQQVAKDTQEILRFQITDVVQVALDVVFPRQYDFSVEFVTKNNKTFADIYLLRNGAKIDPMDASGGGVVDIISFALRLAAWTLSTTDDMIMFDEPFKYLSNDLRPVAGQILSDLSQKLNIQIIMVTHDENMIEIADKVHDVRINNGVSSIRN